MKWRLRTMFVFITLVCIWCAFHGTRARFERFVESEVLALGGTVSNEPIDSRSTPSILILYERCITATFGQRFIRQVNLNAKQPSLELSRDIGRLPHLQVFISNYSSLTDEHVNAICACRQLESLGLGNNPAITDEGARAVSRLPRLRTLDLSRTGISENSLLHISQLRHLKGLSLDGNSLRSGIFTHIEPFNELEWFYAQECGLKDESCTYLSSCTNLRKLHLAQNELTDSGIRQLVGLKLTELTLYRNELTDDVLLEIGKISTLKTLTAGESKITRRGVKEFRMLRPDVDLR